ncbi:MAG: hypothetical protein Fur0032_04260 [Terrimicrobiaceae bacterium]
MSYYGFSPYVSAAERRQRAARELAKIQKSGMQIEPLGELSHRMKIATSFWGRSWCRHLEAFSDYENRLPRGRTYVRNGSIMHLAVTPGKITALVSGSELYQTHITIQPLDSEKWEKIRARCQGGIGSLIELLQGKISDQIMSVVTDPSNGLFPQPGEIHFHCSCPDWAGLCKHSAAVLYGVGAKLDQRPDLLFTLRGVDHGELLTVVDPGVVLGKGGGRKRIADSAIINVFGVDFDSSVKDEPPTPKPALKKAPPTVGHQKGKVGRPTKSRKPAPNTTKTSPNKKKKPASGPGQPGKVILRKASRKKG